MRTKPRTRLAAAHPPSRGGGGGGGCPRDPPSLGSQNVRLAPSGGEAALGCSGEDAKNHHLDAPRIFQRKTGETKTGPGQLRQPGQGLVPLSPLQECCPSGPSTSLKAGFVLCGSPGHKLPHCTGLTTWNILHDDDYLRQVTTKAL